MPSQKSIPISELITTANSELLRLDFKRSALQIYCAEFRKLSDYYSNEKIQDYTATTGREYFQSIYGVNIARSRLQLTKSQSATRRAIRLLDDIFQFGYALRYCHRSYTVNPEYDILLESYLMKCRKKHNSQGTLRTKQMKLRCYWNSIWQSAMRLGLCQKPTKDAFGVSCVITRNQKMEKLFSLRSTSLSILERA